MNVGSVGMSIDGSSILLATMGIRPYIEPDNVQNVRIVTAIVIIVIAVLGLMVRAIPSIDIIFSVLLGAAIYGIFKQKDWGPVMTIIVATLIVVYSIIELAMLQFLPGMYGFSSPELLTFFAILFIIPMDGCCVAAALLALKLKAMMARTVKEIYHPLPGNLPQVLGNCPICGEADIQFVNGVNYRCRRCGYEY